MPSKWKPAASINIKPGGWVAEQGVEIHEMCQKIGMPVWCGGMLETGIGRASNLSISSLPVSACPATFLPRTAITPAM